MAMFFPSQNKFIKLDRTFFELQVNRLQNVEDEQILHKGSNLSWSDLLEWRRVILLAEAGSGKTSEIQNMTRDLREKKKKAFFLRLEHTHSDFEDAFEIGNYQEFEEWLNSYEDAWLFLDSVDEARLHSPIDFEKAIRKLSNHIERAKQRAYIIITGRVTAWRPYTDLDLCEKYLAFKKDEFENNTLSFKFVTFGDLNRKQISTFAIKRGAKNVSAFIDAIDRTDAWVFTTRPQDLEDLILFWNDNGGIGSQLEIIQNSIKRKLHERDQNRAEISALSIERAQQGAKLLAAATTLTRTSIIRIPDGSKNNTGIEVSDVLSDWSPNEIKALLVLPLFDEAIYGCVRFHTRRVREYFTAEWFADLLNKHTSSRRQIEALFFREQYDLKIISPVLRPILPWLIIQDKKIADRVFAIAPELVFEGGVPSKLQLEDRCNILKKVCKQIAERSLSRFTTDYSAIQRFATPDLTNCVRELLKLYTNNDDLTLLLFRMVWIGQMKNARSEVLEAAMSSTTEQYVRVVAIRAIYAIGSYDDQEQVRQHFLNESSELSRVLLAELVDGVKPTKKLCEWLLACLEKIEPTQEYKSDSLSDNVKVFVENADADFLPHLITGFNKLLDCYPLIEPNYCQVSAKFQWLIVAACKAIERFMPFLNSEIQNKDILSVLNKYSILDNYDKAETKEVATDFVDLIMQHKDLNRELFWFDIQKSRQALEQSKDETLTHYRQSSFWGILGRLTKDDFDYVVKEVSIRPFFDDKLVALSVAYDLYKLENKPIPWLIQLKAVTANDLKLTEYLETLSQQELQNRIESEERQNARKLNVETNQRAQQENLEFARSEIYKNLVKLWVDLEKQPGIITHAKIYLLNETRQKMKLSTRLAGFDWQLLIPDYGEEIAKFYRDSAVLFWRHHTPILRSEGEPFNNHTYHVIMGLSGIEIESREVAGWYENLKPDEVTLVCKYASFELNGFPNWLPQIFKQYPQIVANFLLQEIRFELTIDKKDNESSYILSDLRWSGEWAWDEIAIHLYQILQKEEPRNLVDLNDLLFIIQGSNLPDRLIKDIAIHKCKIVTEIEHLASWFAVWIGVDPEHALLALKKHIESIPEPSKQTFFAMIFIVRLVGGFRFDKPNTRQAFKPPQYLKDLYLLMHQYIRIQDDIDRSKDKKENSYLRENAEHARNSLLGFLKQISGKEAYAALLDIAHNHPHKESREWLLTQAKERAMKDGDLYAWSINQIKEFHEKLSRRPNNHHELADLAELLLLDIKDDLENGDYSIADLLISADETVIRNYIGRELREKSLGYYSVAQEDELANAKRPDLRLFGDGFDAPLPIELKLANKWSGAELYERLENQLCSEYLRDNKSRRGIFLLVYQGKDKSSWEVPNEEIKQSFSGLVVALSKYWQEISHKFLNIDNVTVMGMDLTERSRERGKQTRKAK